jgi:hypothetical protein
MLFLRVRLLCLQANPQSLELKSRLPPGDELFPLVGPTTHEPVNMRRSLYLGGCSISADKTNVFRPGVGPITHISARVLIVMTIP